MEGLAPSNLAMSLGLDWNLFVLSKSKMWGEIPLAEI